MKKTLFVIVGALLMANPQPLKAASADDAVGTWKTKTGRHVQLYKCASNLCGKIVKAEAGAKDSKNPNPKLRTRSLKGVQILRGAKKTSNTAWKGTLYNTRDGKLYTGHITVVSKSSVKLSGCGFGGMICKSEFWSRLY